MTVCIAGMHRSGTSMVARLLNLCGMYIGPDEDLIPPSADNPRGYWENIGFVDVNDELLQELGGGWDCPPSPPSSWHDGERFLVQRAKAQSLLAQFEAHRVWGWKDPRNSITLPFWRELVPGLKVVVCLRHPLDVALSLKRRGMTSPQLSVALWLTYNQRLLDATTADERIVTHYESYLRDPVSELRRVARFVGLRPSRQKLDDACRSVAEGRERTGSSRRDLLEAAVGPDVTALYEELCELAAVPVAGPGDDSQPAHAGAPSPAMLAAAQGRREDLRQREAGDAKLDGRLRDVQRELISAAEQRAALDEMLQRQARLLESTMERVDELSRGQREQLRRLESMEKRAAIQAEETLASLYAIEQASRQVDPSATPKEIRYEECVRRIRELVRTTVPAGATVSVLSKGDDDLVRLYGRRGWHFPRDEKGRYSGYHPQSDLAATVHLAAQRAAGAEYLVVPRPSLWWLDHYRGFRDVLEDQYQEIVRQDDVCRIYDVRRAARAEGASDELERLVAELDHHLGREPAVLDATAGGSLQGRSWASQVFRGEGAGDLPYLDDSVDIVVIDDGDPTRTASARRIASKAVVHLAGDRTTVEWKADGRPATPSVSVVIPVYDGLDLTRGCVDSLWPTIPPFWDVEVIVVDDASRDSTAEYLRDVSSLEPRLTVLRSERNQGFLGSVSRGAEAAGGDVLVFLNNDTVLLPGWLSKLMRTFAERPEAGAVGGRLVYPDGRLQEAGGLVFSDGSAAKFGYGEAAVEDPLFNFVREVDYCSGALLATPREVFTSIGGFDPTFAPGYYEDTDYCFSVRASGRQVYYQPESTIIHVEGGTAGVDLDVGAKRYQVINQAKFVQKWRDALRHQPERPPRLDRTALQALAVRQPVRAAAGVLQ